MLIDVVELIVIDYVGVGFVVSFIRNTGHIAFENVHLEALYRAVAAFEIAGRLGYWRGGDRRIGLDSPVLRLAVPPASKIRASKSNFLT